MVSKTHIILAMAIGLLVTTSQTLAQDEQWLQYHSARELGLLGGGMQPQPLELNTEKPPGVELPQFKLETPFFARWSTPMVKSGYLWVALDREHKQGPYDLLYIDSNGNGHLNDETAVAAYRMDQYSTYFGPVKVIFEIEDGPVTYHLNFRSYAYDERNSRLYASSGGWYEGDITVAGAKKHCVLFDCNANGTFDDKSANAGQCDRIRIGEEGARDARFVGNYIEVGRILYRPEIARDGACIKLTRAEDVKFGSVRLPESVTQVSANGENGLFTRKPEKGVASLPLGQYHVYDWIIDRKDDKGIEWRLQGSGPAQTSVFDITEGKEIELAIGEPIVATLDASANEGTHSFRHALKGRDGERIELTRNGAQPQAPKVRIKSADGKYDRTYSFEYG
ncbi:MAG TPA: hypothetical protein VMW24_11750 [Sedimentisphaerales bacterium]|nr:hypothetical protein [Sedimentisphaerales bacterium]